MKNAFRALALALCALTASRAAGATAVLNVATNFVPLGSAVGGVNDSVSLVDSPGSVTVNASGNSTFGSLAGETYDSVALVYIDSAGKLQYASVPNNSSTVLAGSHYNSAFITDLQGASAGNTGSTVITENDSANHQITSGTIFAGSQTPAQTGVAPLTSTNSAFFDTAPVGVPGFFNVSVTGNASYDGAGDQYSSVVVQYRDPTNGITYASLPVGSSQTYFGFRFFVYVTESTALAGTGSGNLTINFTQVPEPAALSALAATALLVERRRSRR